MLFGHDTEVALAAADDGDLLPDVRAVDAVVAEWRWTGSRRHDRVELDAVRVLRPRLRQVWSADEAAVVDIVNRLLRESSALPQLVEHDGWGYHVHATAPESALADRMAVEAAMALTDVIRGDELSRQRTCAADNCHDVLVDLSKNRSRRFCSTACSNRTNVAAFRSRRAGAAG